jgi:RNA polymerase sigma-70 factor (ECF subfamily)
VTSHPNEAILVAKAQRGDDEAFAVLVELYQRPVYNLCYRMLGNANDAEDAAQESFIRAYKSIKRFDLQRKFSSWLLTIASNYCIDQHRRRKLPSFSIEALPVPDIEDEKPGIETGMVMGEHQDQIREMLGELKEADRAAVVLRYWYDYSYEEIAESLDMTVSAIKSRLHRARRDMALAWMEAQQDNPAFERMQHESAAY